MSEPENTTGPAVVGKEPAPRTGAGASALAPDWLPAPGDVNVLTEPLWADGVARDAAGQLTVQGITAAELAETFGTPLLVVDEDDFRARARAFKEGFDAAFAQLCGGADVYFAGKSFLTLSTARWAAEEGLRVDTASGGELAIALRAGVDPAHVGLHGNNKSDAELLDALTQGVGRIIVDSVDAHTSTPLPVTITACACMASAVRQGQSTVMVSVPVPPLGAAG